MPWKTWSEDARRQVANAGVTAVLVLYLVLAIRNDDIVLARLAALAILINVIGALWLLRRMRRNRSSQG